MKLMLLHNAAACHAYKRAMYNADEFSGSAQGATGMYIILQTNSWSYFTLAGAGLLPRNMGALIGHVSDAVGQDQSLTRAQVHAQVSTSRSLGGIRGPEIPLLLNIKVPVYNPKLIGCCWHGRYLSVLYI